MQHDWSSKVWLLSFIDRFPEFNLELNPKKFSKHCWCFYWIFDKSVSNVLALWTGDLERAYHRRFVELQRLRSMWAILVLTWPFLLSASTESEFARTFSQWLYLSNPGNPGQIFCIMVCPGSVGSHGSSSLLFMMKVMVWHFVSNSHKVTTALIVMLPSNWCLWRFLCNLIDICQTLDVWFLW